MTKEQIEELRYIEMSIKAIQEDLKQLNESMQDVTGKVYTDVVKGSTAEYPYIERHFQIEGVDYRSYERLRKKLQAKEWELQDKLAVLEEWLEGIEDERLYLIFRMKYRNGMTNKEIADELGYDKSRISQLINKYLQSN